MRQRDDRKPATPLQQARRAARSAFVGVGVFSALLNLLMLVSPLYMMQVFDRVLSSGRVETLLMLTLIAGFALLVLGGLEAIRQFVLGRVGRWLEDQIGPHLIRAGVAETLGGRPGGAQSLRDLSQIRSFVGGQGITPLFDAPWIPVWVAVIWLLHPWLGLLALGAALLLFALALMNEVATRAPLREANEQQLSAQAHAAGASRHADVVHAMGMLPQMLDRWRRINRESLAAQGRAGDIGGLLVGTSRFARLAVQVATLGLGAFLVLRGQLTAGGMIAASILLGRALAPVEQAIGGWKNLVAARAAAERLEALLAQHPVPPRAMKLPPPDGNLVVDRVIFRPPGMVEPILKQVSFGLPAGQMLGVIGPTAAGKSTLCRLLVGIFPPTAGSICLDAAKVHQWDRADFGRHVGYLPQDVQLLSGSVAENIARLGEPDPQAVVSAAKGAGIHDMILKLPQGYDTALADGGLPLSGGQCQRLGLARALYGDPRLLVLDEPTAAADEEGEAALEQALTLARQRGCTVVAVSHRPRSLALADRLLVLRDGAVAMIGDRREIMARLGQVGGEQRPVAVA